MNSLVKDMDKMDIVDSKYQHKFLLDNNLKNDCCYFVAKVQLSFYQLWSMFSELPCVYESKTCKYEWKFVHVRTGAVFSIYDWKNKNTLLNTKTWYIGGSVNDKEIVNEFLMVLCDAIECYNRYYKVPIETKTFKSDIVEVQNGLNSIKRSIVDNREILKNL
jgi:hypothetical protein